MVYKIVDGVILTVTEEGAYFEKEKDHERFVVAGAGIEFVKLIDGKRDMDEILEALIKIFGPNVEPYILAKDLERFMADLASNDLVSVTKSEHLSN